MNWQDILFAVGQGVLAASLVFAFRSPPPRGTSIPTGLVLAAFAITYITMGFWYSFATAGTSAALWGALAVKGSGSGR